jgi:clan AA aspartic protease
MGLVYADITLINAGDEALAKHKVIGDEEVKKMTVNMLVDTGAYMMGITETVQEQLDLPFVEKRKLILGDGSIKEFEVVGPVTVKFKNRTAVCHAVVLAGSSESIIGAIPLEEMDVLIHPQRQELIVNPEHPYYAQLSMK